MYISANKVNVRHSYTPQQGFDITQHSWAGSGFLIIIDLTETDRERMKPPYKGDPSVRSAGGEL